CDSCYSWLVFWCPRCRGLKTINRQLFMSPYRDPFCRSPVPPRRIEFICIRGYLAGSVDEAMDESPFQNLIRRIRSGDEEAARQLVNEYEPAIRRAARIRLADSRLRRIFDSSAISQRVCASFFVRAALGEYDLDRPAPVLALLVAMSQKKLTDHSRAEGALRRDYRRVRLLGADEPATNPNPGAEVAARELIADFRRRMSAEERQVADARAGGESWQNIAAARGESPDAVRVRFSRAVDRIAEEVGLDL